MRKVNTALVVAAMVAAGSFAGTANAATVISSATFTANTSSGSPSPTAGYTVVQNFDSCALGANSACGGMSGTYHINTGTDNMTGNAPFGGDTTNYLSVYATDANPTATYTFAAPTTSIQFDWGSAASTDSLTILTTGGSYSFTVPNSTASNPAVGNYNQNGLFTATAASGYLITGLQFSASQNSFEVENIATASAVPEPATWGTMILGFGLMGGALRRRKQIQGALKIA